MLKKSFAFLVLAVFSGFVPSIAAASTATFQIQLVDGSGSVLRDGTVRQFREFETGRDLSSKFHYSDLEITAVGIPYGKYSVSLHEDGYADLSFTFDVERPDVWLEIAMKTATLHMVAINSFGTLGLGSVKAEALTDLNGIDWSSHLVGNIAANLPYSVYQFRGYVPGFSSISQEIDVFEPEAWAVVGFALGGEKPTFLAPLWQLKGTITKIPFDEEPVYVRLTGAYFDSSLSAAVDVQGSTGTFALRGATPWGTYVVLVIGKDRILDVQPIDIRSDNAISIELADKGKAPQKGLR